METITINLNKVHSKQSYIDLLADELQFPAYFGNNLDAVDECMRDLNWLKGDVRIVFTNTEKLAGRDPRLFTLIQDSIRYYQAYWRQAESSGRQIELEIK